MQQQDIAETTADNSTADSSVAAGKAVQPSLSRGRIRFAFPSSARSKNTESAQDPSSRIRREGADENTMNTQRRAALGALQQEHSSVEEPEEDMAEDIRIRTYAFNATAQQHDSRPMYKTFPTPTRDQGKLAELLKAFGEHILLRDEMKALTRKQTSKKSTRQNEGVVTRRLATCGVVSWPSGGRREESCLHWDQRADDRCDCTTRTTTSTCTCKRKVSSGRADGTRSPR